VIKLKIEKLLQKNNRPQINYQMKINKKKDVKHPREKKNFHI